MLDASGYGCLAAHKKGERHSASSYEFVTVCSSACYILLYLVSDGCDGSASSTALHHIITGTKKAFRLHTRSSGHSFFYRQMRGRESSQEKS